MRVDESASGSELRLRAGERLEVVLAEAPTTGYRWRLVSEGAPACRRDSDRFEAPPSATAGGPGRYTLTFTFASVQPGAGEIELTCARTFGEHRRGSGPRCPGPPS